MAGPASQCLFPAENSSQLFRPNTSGVLSVFSLSSDFALDQLLTSMGEEELVCMDCVTTIWKRDVKVERGG